MNVHKQVPLFAFCPNCGHRKECDTLGNAMKYASEHNRRCKEQRPKQRSNNNGTSRSV